MNHKYQKLLEKLRRDNICCEVNAFNKKHHSRGCKKKKNELLESKKKQS